MSRPGFELQGPTMKSVTPSTERSIAPRQASPDRPDFGRGERRMRVGWLAITLGLLACLAFVPTLNNGFVDVWDDDHNFLKNIQFRGLGRDQIVWAWSTDLLGVYQPLAWMLLEA